MNARALLLTLRGRFHLNGPQPVLADWFTGVLRLPRGEILHYVHMGYGTVYEEEEHITVERGEVTDSRVIDNRDKQLFEIED